VDPRQTTIPFENNGEAITNLQFEEPETKLFIEDDNPDPGGKHLTGNIPAADPVAMAAVANGDKVQTNGAVRGRRKKAQTPDNPSGDIEAGE
jgi:hypothetical protein